VSEIILRKIVNQISLSLNIFNSVVTGLFKTTKIEEELSRQLSCSSIVRQEYGAWMCFNLDLMIYEIAVWWLRFEKKFFQDILVRIFKK